MINYKVCRFICGSLKPLFFFFHFSPPHPVIMLLEGNYSSPNYSKVARGLNEIGLFLQTCIEFRTTKKISMPIKCQKIHMHLLRNWHQVCIFRHIRTLSHSIVYTIWSFILFWIDSPIFAMRRLELGTFTVPNANFNILMRNN